MTGIDPAWLSATEIARLVGAGSLDPQAVVRAPLAAIERLAPRIHAYIHVDREAHSSPGPFAGVTLAVKDSQPVAGMPYTYGTSSWQDRVAETDAVAVARGRSAGMAILGKTNLPELAASIGTANALFGSTQNPWREGITPGGSSGGRGGGGGGGEEPGGPGGGAGGARTHTPPAGGRAAPGSPPPPQPPPRSAG